MKNFLAAALLLLLYSCGGSATDSSIPQYQLEPTSEVDLNKLIPNSYLINSPIAQRGDSLFYWDSAKSQVMLLNSDFEWLTYLSNGLGNGPEQVSFFSGLSLTYDHLFLIGEKAVAYRLDNLYFAGKFRLPSTEISWILPFAGRYVMGGLLYEENRYVIFSTSFNENSGFTEVIQELDIPFPENFDELSMVTTASIMDDALYVFKTELGELVKINQQMEFEYDKELPLGIGREKNLVREEDGSTDYQSIEAWDFVTHSGKIYVLRNSDKAGEPATKAENTRKTIHVYNPQAEAIGSISLPEKAFYLSFINDQLCTIDHKEETCFCYEVLE